MDYCRQGEHDFASCDGAAGAGDSKKNATPLLSALEALCARALEGTGTRQARRVSEHLLAQLVCLGTHTITGLLQTLGAQFKDWSADYRLYKCNRVEPEQCFAPVRTWLCEHQAGPLVLALDDTLVRKRGKKTAGVKYRRDPLGPPFHVNFVLGQRFLQSSLACKGPHGRARMIPIDWVHAPQPQKPDPRAAQEKWVDYQQQCRQSRLGLRGAQRIQHLRSWFNEHQAAQRRLWVLVDGSFTNRSVLRNLPPNTTLVGRIRADAKLYYPPDSQPQHGRRRHYGALAPTPAQLRHAEAFPWQTIAVFLGGKTRSLRIKQLGPLRWRTAGPNLNLQLLVIAPTRYRLTTHGRTCYRQPCFLICTDPQASAADIVQYYLWRWDIEVNFRDEKTILGIGEAQVRLPASVQNVTGCAVAAYASLLTAAAQCQHQHIPFDHLPPPGWYKRKKQRATTMQLIQNLRAELWTQSIYSSGFKIQHQAATKSQKCNLDLQSAVIYASSYS